MASKKGQLFLVAIIFLLGMIFAIQQALFQYTALDISEPLHSDETYLIRNIVNLVNRTIKDTYYCNDTVGSFEDEAKRIKKMLQDVQGSGIYSFDMAYDIDCSKWFNSPPDDPPLVLAISVTGFGRETGGRFSMYHMG